MSLAAASCGLALVSIYFIREHGLVAAVWPGNALAVAVLLRGKTRAPLYAAAAMLGCLAANLIVGDPPVIAVALALCNMVEIVVCVVLARRLVGGATDLNRARDMLLFMIAGGLAPLVSAAVATFILDGLRGAPPLPTFLQWYAADALGLVIVTPVVLALSGSTLTRLRAALGNGHAVTPALALAVALTLGYGQSAYPLGFFIMPALFYCAFRLGVPGTAFALLVTAITAVVGTRNGFGVTGMIVHGFTVKLAVLQAYLATMTIVVLPLAAVFAERRRLEQSLRATLAASELAEQRLNLAGQLAGIGYWRREPPVGSSVWSDVTYAIHGITREDYAHRIQDIAALYVDEDRPLLVNAIEEALATGGPFELKARFVRPDTGELRIAHFKGEAERDATGAIAAIFGVVCDVTDKETFIRRIEESEARYRLLADVSTDVVFRISPDDIIQYVSPAIRRYGYDPVELVGRTGASLIHPDDEAKLVRNRQHATENVQLDPHRDRNYRLRTADGGYVWMEGNPSVVRDEAGRMISIVTALRDVSERVATVNALAESEARHRVVAEKASDIILRTDIDGTIHYLSPSVETVTGFTAQDLLGQPVVRHAHPDDVPLVLAAFQELIKGARPDGVPMSYRTRHKAGHWIWLESKPTAVRDADGRVLEFLDVARDISAHKALEVELLAARDAAEAGAAAKAEFMANMSHEIRTPLTAILGFTSLIAARNDLAAEVRYQMGRITGAGQALLSIVNDVLDFSKLEAGLMPIQRAPASPLETLSDALALFEPQAATKGIELVLDCPDDLPAQLSLDPDRVRQILLNMVGNAVKFTDRGQVVLAAAYDIGAERLRVTIRDSGDGMGAEQLGKLFQRFSQVDGSATRRHGGTGLGLAICRGLVEAMGGEIGVSSTIGQGSVFSFEIPAPMCDAADVSHETAASFGFAGLRVLVVDDNPVNRELTSAILTPFGVEVSEAVDGLVAVEMAQAAAFDLILMDIRMPRLDGPDATLRIRALPGPNRNIPILAFSADYDVERFGAQLGAQGSARGFDGFVRKPLELHALVQAIADAVGWADEEEEDRASA